MALASLRYSLPKYGATFQVSHEQPLGGKDSVDDFPQRTRLSVDKTITKKASVRISHDILRGSSTGGQNTALGISYAPWAGTEVTAGSDMITSDSGRRVGATVGLDQQFQINDKWSASAGVSNRRILNSTGTIEQIAPDAAVSSFETNESYTAAYMGLGYRTDSTSVSGRVEAREAADAHSYTASIAAARELSEKLSFAGALRANFAEQRASGGLGFSGSSSRVDGRIGAAWRPRDEGLILLNRFDVSVENSVANTKTTKLVNNLAANAQVSDRWQLAGNYGVKYVETSFGGENYSGFTHLLGAETRYDITERIDVGLHGSVLYGQSSGTTAYSFGPSVGVSPVDNVWFSLGYNVIGYKEEDIDAAAYSQKGAYVKFRFKFDQNSARGLLDMISPRSE